MKTITLEISNEEYKAMEATVPSVEEWIGHALKNKIRQCVDRIFEEYSDKRANRVSMEEKLAVIRPLDLTIRKARDEAMGL